MSVETLERPLDTPNLESSVDTKQVLDGFFHAEDIIDGGIPEISSLDIGDIGRNPDIENFSETKAETNYNILKKTAQLSRDPVESGIDHDLDVLHDVVGPITDERIGSALIRLSDAFQSSNKKGYFTAYEAKQPGGERSKYNVYETGLPRAGEGLLTIVGETVHETQEAPWDARRRPIQLENADVEALTASTEDDKIAFLSEVLNPYRYRKDADAPRADLDAQTREETIASDLLNTLPDSWRRDLIATEAVKYYLDKHINKPELAQKALQLISTLELRDGILASLKLASESTPKHIVQETQLTSPKALEKLLKYTSEEENNSMKKEAIEKADQFAVTINMPLDTLEKVLFDTFHLLSYDKTKKSGASGWSDTANRRWQEDRRGFHPENESILDRPIYAALVVSDKEKITGAAPRYGGCVMTLKDEVALNRTIYTYGDSSHSSELSKDNQNDDRLAMPEATVAKILYDKQKQERVNGVVNKYDYIEAQVLGGVDVNDIESITIPWRGVLRNYGILKTIQDEYPGLNLSVSVDSSETIASYKISEEDTKKLTDRGIKVLVA